MGQSTSWPSQPRPEGSRAAVNSILRALYPVSVRLRCAGFWLWDLGVQVMAFFFFWGGGLQIGAQGMEFWVVGHLRALLVGSFGTLFFGVSI